MSIAGHPVVGAETGVLSFFRLGTGKACVCSDTDIHFDVPLAPLTCPRSTVATLTSGTAGIRRPPGRSHVQ